MKISLFPPLPIHEIGHRDNQEDALWPLKSTTDDCLFVLCDGMGGHEHGEVASQTVTQAIGEWYNSKAILPLDKQQIEDAITYAYVQLDQKDGGELRKMGTTLTLLYMGDNGAIAAHMGDSRIYHIRPDKGVLYQSRDHSLVFDLFQSGEITYEEMANFAQKNIVTRAMTPGEDNRMRPDIIHITDIQPGDYFYMCSDGMLEQMTNRELVALLSSDISDEEKRQQLIAATANNQDNHTAWIIHVKDVVMEEGDEQLVNEEPTARCNAINILPQKEEDTSDDVEIVSDNDVVIVSESPVQSKIKLKWIRKGIIFLIAILAFALIWLLFHPSEKETEVKRPKTMMQTPIPPRSNNNTTNKDTNQYRDHESAGNQQQIDAQGRNSSTGHIQDR